MDRTGHITDGHKNDSKFVAEILFNTINDIDPEKKCVDLYIFDGSSVCRKAKKY